ncbi:MAG: hypothetical protein ACTS1Z_07750 [Parasphingopyxis sp.]|uniref:hypothetical protein n=1 Tax=Parasphingopyxis sp. TaxID=1920299 RepID=UPI003F9F1305
MPEQNDDEDIPPDTGGLVVTIEIAETDGDCSFAWNGERLSRSEMFDRGYAILDAAVEAHQGAENMRYEDIPYWRISAPRDLAFNCVSLAIGTMREVGFPSGQLAIDGSATSILLDFEIFWDEPIPDPDSTRRNVIALDDVGIAYVLGQRTDDANLADRAIQNLRLDPTAASLIPILTIVNTGPDYYLLPSARTEFDRVVEVAALLRANDIHFNLVGCYLNDREAELLPQHIGEPLSRCGLRLG